MKMALLLALLVAGPAKAEVSYERLLNSRNEPGSWLMHSGNYSGQRFSELAEIDTTNARFLRPAWIYQAEGRVSSINASPLVVDGLMYISEPPGTVTALDARTGVVVWRYRHRLPEGHIVQWVNRGVAISGRTVFYSTHDAYLLAIDADSGHLRWKKKVEEYLHGHVLAAAPLIVKDRVIVGSTTGQRAVRGFIDAYDVRTAERIWRFWTVPAPGEPNNDTWSGDSWKTGGAGAWVTGSFDPQLNLLFWGTGNPVPAYDGEARKGDNLYANSLLALDVDTGKLRWHFQFTPHDLWDWDASHVPVLVDRVFQGRPRKLILTANKNGYYYVLDRETGRFLVGEPIVRQNWSDGLGPSGRPRVRSSAIPGKEWTVIRPVLFGGTNWTSPTYSPLTAMFYVTVRDDSARIRRVPAPLVSGEVFNWGGATQILESPDDFHGLKALDPDTGQLNWQFKVARPTYSGLLSTAGGLVFGGSMDGHFFALDAKSGKPLWHFQTGGKISGNPVTFAVDGKQYVVTPAGNAVIAFALPTGTAAIKSISRTRRKPN